MTWLLKAYGGNSPKVSQFRLTESITFIAAVKGKRKMKFRMLTIRMV